MNDQELADFIYNSISAKRPDAEWQKELGDKGFDYGVIRRILDQLISLGRIYKDKNSHKGSTYHYYIPLKEALVNPQVINFINPEAVKHILSQICNNVAFPELNNKDFELPFSEIKPTEGYQISFNEQTGEKFPYCCETHKKAFKDAEEWFAKFPNCCAEHRKLLQASWFKKENFKEAPIKVLRQVDYTMHQIIKQIETPEWYKEITDYIEANIYSFGQLPSGYGGPVGLHLYWGHIKFVLGNKDWLVDKGISIDKSIRLLEYINGWENPTEEPAADLNALYITYQKWLNLFPFEISYFNQLKQYFEQRLPFLAGNPELNKYTGLAKAKLQTQSGLTESLINTTTQLLRQVNTADLVAKDLISDNNKHSIELTNEAHRIKQAGLLGKFSESENRYVAILEKWLTNEKEYFKEIISLLNKVDVTSAKAKTTPSREANVPLPVIALKYRYLQLAGEHEGITLSTKFREIIFRDKRYVDYPEIIEFYTGIDRNKEDALTILNKDLGETLHPTLLIINQKW